MKTINLNVEIEFTEPLLATNSGNPELHREFIAKNAPEHEKVEEEMAALPAEEQVAKAMTVFAQDEKGLFLWDYHWKGYIKENIGAFCELGMFKKLSKWTFKRAVDQSIFVLPRRCHLMRNGKFITEPDGQLQRPIRATTMQGDRVALANSERVDAGATTAIKVVLMASENAKSVWSELTADVLKEVFARGALSGHGQWRGGGYGRFNCKISDAK